MPDATRLSLRRSLVDSYNDLKRRLARHGNHSDIADIYDLSDEDPLADRIVAAREEVAKMMEALAELPERQRAAFFKCFRGDTRPEVLADEYGVSVRTIQSDIRSAILHCAERTGRKNILAGQRVRHSRKQEG